MKPVGEKAAGADRLLRVCPSLQDEQYLLTIQQLSNSFVRGCAGSLILDRGENFLQSRAYLPGDPTSSIDWKASARSRGLVIKEHESLRQKVVSFVVDRSGSMTIGSGETSKYAAACVLCGGLALAALKLGSPVALILSDHGMHLPPTLSSSAVSAGLAAMRWYRLRETTPLSRCLEEGFGHRDKQQLVFVLSDFHDICVTDPIARLAQEHEVVLIRLEDPSESRIPFHGTFRLRPAEGGLARTVRRQRPLASPWDTIHRTLRLPSVTIDPSRPVSRQISNFLTLRQFLP